MTVEYFGYPFTYWVGMTTLPETDAAALGEFNRFYSHTHLPEVLASNPGFVRATRFELVSPDPRGDHGPRWLAVYELADETAALGYLARNDAAPSAAPSYSAGPSAWGLAVRPWRMMWRRIGATGSTAALPHAIYLVGMNVPGGTDAAGLAEFNAFYTNVHVPEVMAAGGYARGTRFELFRDLRHPPPGCPRFCAIYEADAAATQALVDRRANPDASPPGVALSAGPPTWEAHETLWRLVYRRIGTGGAEGD